MPTTHATKSTTDKGNAVANDFKQKYGGGDAAGFTDNRPEAQTLGSQIQWMRNSAQAQRLATVQRMVNGSNAPVQMVTYRLGKLNPTYQEVKKWLEDAIADNNPNYKAMAVLNLGRIKETSSQADLNRVVNGMNMFMNAAPSAAASPAASAAPNTGAPVNPTGEAVASAHSGPATPVVPITAPANPTGEAMASAGHTPAPAPMPIAEPEPKTLEQMRSELNRQLAIWYPPGSAAPTQEKYYTGFNGEGKPNEKVRKATLAALSAEWAGNPHKQYILPAGNQMSVGMSKSTFGKPEYEQLHDFIAVVKLKNPDRTFVFNFHTGVAPNL